MVTEPPWLTIARRDIGVIETPGSVTTPRIQRALLHLKAAWKDDETPWCGSILGDWFYEAGVPYARNPWRALAWLDWGDRGDGASRLDFGMLLMRNMVSSPEFAEATLQVTKPGQEAAVIGPYPPRTHHMRKEAFEALGCRLPQLGPTAE